MYIYIMKKKLNLKQMGGAQPDAVWSIFMENEIFKNRLVKDTSLKNVNAVNTDGSTNNNKVNIFFIFRGFY